MVNEQWIAAKALGLGVKIYPASDYFLEHMPQKPTFILGYSNLSENQIRMGIKKVALAEKECREGP